MSNFLKSNSAKVVLGLVAFAFAFAGTAQAYTFTAPTLKQGSKGAAVMELQKALNLCTDTMIASGAGSTGYETTNFGAKTKVAVKAWQTKVGLTADGIFGQKGRTAMNANGCGTTGTPVVPVIGQTGPVTAMLSTDNPAAGTLVAGQATADLAHFTFSGTGTVTNVTLQRIGVSADSTPSNVYLFDGATRLTDAASVSNTGTVTFNIPAGIFSVSGMKNIKVKSDIASGTSGQTVGMMLKSFATAAGSTTANLSGNVHNIASATLASVSAGTVTPSGATINPGANVTLWQSTLTISNRDIWVKRLALRNVGSAPASAFQNFKLYVGGVQVGTSAGMDSMGYVTFDLNTSPVLLVAGSRLVRVDADVVSGASRTVQLSLRQAADVDFVDSSFGVNITPTSTPWAPSAASTIAGTSGGSLSIEKDVTSPSGTAILNGTDVNLGTFKLTAYGEPIKIETLLAGGTFDGSLGSTTTGTVTLRNGRLLINGVQYGSSATLVAAGTSFTTNYTVMPGTPVLVEIHADVYNNNSSFALDAGDTILAKIMAGTSNATRIDSLGSFAAPDSVNISANPVTVASASLTLAKNGTYTNQTVTLPATNFKIGSWNLTGSSVEDVLLTTLSFDIRESTGTEFDEGDITNMYAVVKNSSRAIVAQASPIATLGTGADQNFSINYTLAKNNNLVVELYANLADDGLDKVAGVSGGSDAIDAADAFDTVLMLTGTSMTSGATVTSGNGSTTISGQAIAYGNASITATLGSGSPVSGIVYDNQTVESADFSFAAITSGYIVTDITLALPATGATVVDNVMLYDESTLIKSVAGGSTSATFSGLTWNVPANQSKVLTVKLQLSGVGVGAGTSESDLTTTLTAFTASNTSTGVSAGGTETDPAGNAIAAFASVPVVTVQTLSNTTLSNQSGKTLLKFKIDATGGAIGWNQLYFAVTKDANTLVASSSTGGVTLWDVTNGGNTAVAGTFANSAAMYTGTGTSGTIKFNSTAEQQISSVKTFELRGTITAADAVGDFVTTTLANTNSTTVTALGTSTGVAGAATAPLIWSDLSASGHTSGTSDWTTDFGVKDLPISDSLNF